MLKNTNAMKSKTKPKSTRKPLLEVSNAKTAINSDNVSKTISKDDGGLTGDDSLDRLLLVHSDISDLLRQIDDLVVQALQLTSNKGRKEIDQFADVLSEIRTSLTPWVPKFQEALPSQSTRPENKSEQPIGKTVSFVPKESTSTVFESPEQTKWESLVSPSPLVSWRAECNTEGGRQLFLLTPLPQRKPFSSKCQASLPTVENATSDDITYHANIPDSVQKLGISLSQSIPAKPTPNKTLDVEVTNIADDHKIDFVSPKKFSNTNCSLPVLSPCLKMSPPKSCILLEPISEFSKKKTRGVYRCTPFPARVESGNDSQDSEFSDDLKLNYPELYRIKIDNLQKRMVEEDSPNWIISPPKTCVILEPSDDLSPGDLIAAVSNRRDGYYSVKRKECQDIIRALDLAQCTPMMEPMSSFRTGKHPGENTLKKELWTKFEAASTHAIRFIQTTTGKGFLDILDEASDA